MSEEQENAVATEETPDAAKALVQSDDLVDARWDFALLPEENVSIHFQVSPKDPADAVTSVQTSFVEKKDHVVVHSFAGSSTQELVDPKAGQGALGDCGVDVTVFSGRGDGELFAVLAGTVRHGEETRGFFFERQFEL